MKKLVILATLATLSLATNALAAPSYVPAPPPKPHQPPPKPHHPPVVPPKPRRCVPHSSGYNASGTLLSVSLTPVGHRRYNGTLVVDLAWANHRAPTGEASFALSGVRIRFHRGVDPASPAAGSRVRLHGKVTELPRRCPSAGFTPTVTVKKVDIATARRHHRGIRRGRRHWNRR